MAVECHYRVGEIDEMPFRSALQMADYWAIEPPFSYLYYVSHFKQEGQEQAAEGAFQPNLPANSYDNLAPAIQLTVRKQWMKKNPGKSEADFFKALRKRKNDEYAAKLQMARKAQSSGR